MRPRGLSRSSPSTWYVGHVAVQKPQCTHFRRMASASRPSGVPRMKSASWVCIGGGYTFRMKMVIWLALLGIVAGFGYAFWLVLKKHAERKRAAEERLAAFIAQTVKPAAPKLAPVPASAPASVPASVPMARAVVDLVPQKFLLEAASKAGEAGEPALSLQLYARLIARYPDGPFSAQALAAVEALKSKLAR